MGRLLWVYALLAAACGRIDFTPPDRDPDAMASPDAPVGLDADADADASGACPVFALFCDDFESGDLSRWTGTAIDGPATLDLSGSQVHAGVYALDAKVAPDVTDGGNAAPYLHFAVPRSTGTLAVREWITASPKLELFNMVIVLLHDTTDQFAGVGGNNTGEWVVTDDPGTGITTDHDSTVVTPAAGTWTCVELVYTFAGGASTIDLYIDEALVMTDTANDPAPAFTDVQIGVARADSTGIEVITDDVVIADRRIGCE